MPLREREKHAIVAATLSRHYPRISPDLRRHLLNNIAKQFNGNLSPVRREQESSRAAGTGNSLENYTIGVTYGQSRQLPRGVSVEELGAILSRNGM